MLKSLVYMQYIIADMGPKQRRNLSSVIYDVVASGGLVVYGYGDRTPAPSSPYAAEDVVIVSN